SGIDPYFSEPNRVALADVTDLAAAGRTVCALAGGDVFCWGGGEHFPPGGLHTPQKHFISAAFPSPSDFGCFLADDGERVCGLRSDYRPFEGLSHVDEIVTTGVDRLCTRRRDGGVACIERDGTVRERPFLSHAKHLIAGLPCALLEDGRVRCDGWTHEGVA